VYDFNHTRRLRLFLNLNGDLLSHPWHLDFKHGRAKLRKIKRFSQRHWLPDDCGSRSESFRRRLQVVGFSSHAVITASRMPDFCAAYGKKGDGLAKNFSSQLGGFVLQLLQMKYPASSGILVPSTFIFPDGHFKQTY